jgi:DNA helicase HerA-like ATPase
VQSGENKSIKIGTSPLAGNADVKIDPNRLFGRHLAVLGNTGSGKSCSVAGLIRWSIEAAMTKRKEVGIEPKPNARFIILDPNGEYERAFTSSGEDDSIKPRIFKVTENIGDINHLKVPLWFWNSNEWSSFALASDKTQRPLLQRALREIKSGRDPLEHDSEEEKKLYLQRYLSSRVIWLTNFLNEGTHQKEENKVGFRLKAFIVDLQSKIDLLPEFSEDLKNINTKIEEAINSSFNSFQKDSKTIEFFRAFNESQINEIITAMRELLTKLGGILYEDTISEDIPIQYSGSKFCDHVSILGEERNITQYIDLLVMRIKTILSDVRMKKIVGDEVSITLSEWLSNYIGDDNSTNGCLTIIDLSLVPPEIIHITTSVIARMVFEALQRYRKIQEEHKILPTVLVMEEAHNYIRRYIDESENHDAATLCCKTFERIAREGRKFGLGLVLSSQRPSELSPTVLSQCNTFLLHRISNDRDQDLVQRFVPDNLQGILRDLPTLPSQNAILLGWATELPVLVRMNDLPKNQQPQSDDPDFWNVWTGKDQRDVNWEEIAKDWQQNG